MNSIFLLMNENNEPKRRKLAYGDHVPAAFETREDAELHLDGLYHCEANKYRVVEFTVSGQQ